MSGEPWKFFGYTFSNREVKECLSQWNFFEMILLYWAWFWSEFEYYFKKVLAPPACPVKICINDQHKIMGKSCETFRSLAKVVCLKQRDWHEFQTLVLVYIRMWSDELNGFWTLDKLATMPLLQISTKDPLSMLTVKACASPQSCRVLPPSWQPSTSYFSHRCWWLDVSLQVLLAQAP